MYVCIYSCKRYTSFICTYVCKYICTCITLNKVISIEFIYIINIQLAHAVQKGSRLEFQLKLHCGVKNPRDFETSAQLNKLLHIQGKEKITIGPQNGQNYTDTYLREQYTKFQRWGISYACLTRICTNKYAHIYMHAQKIFLQF